MDSIKKLEFTNDILLILLYWSVGLGCGILLMIFFGMTITSNKRIKPKIKITIENGKSDTLFIYKEL